MKNNKVLIAVAVIIFGLILVGGFLFINNKPGQKTPTQTNNQSQNQPDEKQTVTSGFECSLDDRDLCKYLETTTKQDVFSQGLTINSINYDADAKQTTTETKFDGQGNSQIVSYDNGKETANIISLNGALYTKDYTDNQWLKYPTTQTEEQTESEIDKMKADLEQYASDLQSNIEFKKLGKEPCGKYTCHVYQLGNLENSDTVETLYFDDQQFLLRKTMVEFSNGSKSEMEYVYGSVSIKTPNPIKEMPNLDDYIQDSTSQTDINSQDIEDLKKQIQEQMGE